MQYEVVIMFAEDTPKKEHQAVLKDVEAWLVTKSLSITKTEELGKKELVYEINKCREAFYYVLSVEGKKTNVSELNILLNRDKRVLRYLLTQLVPASRKKTKKKTV